MRSVEWATKNNESEPERPQHKNNIISKKQKQIGQIRTRSPETFNLVKSMGRRRKRTAKP